MKRPRQHILEKESIDYLNEIFPKSWIISQEHIDYGIDFNAEIFINENSTGNKFYIQLKGTDNKCTKKGDLSIKIETKNLKYYQTLSLPVLIVFYSSELKQARAIWANNLMKQKKIKDRQKTHKLALGENSVIDKSFFKNLEHSFTDTIYNKVNIEIQQDSSNLIHQNWSKRIRHWLNQFYGNQIEFDNFTLYNKVQINITHNQGSDLLDIISPQKNVTQLVLPNAPYIYRTRYDAFVRDDEVELLYDIIRILKDYHLSESLEFLIFIIGQKKEVHMSSSEFQLFVLTATSHVEHLILDRLLNLLINLKLWEYAKAVMFVLHMYNEISNNKYLEIGHKCVNSDSDEFSKGLMCYNIANALSNSTQPNLAIHYYNLSRKLNPAYNTTNYWIREVASCLFYNRRYLLSAIFYKKYVEFETKNDTVEELALIADCYFHAGMYNDCINYAMQYIETRKGKHVLEWMRIVDMANQLNETYGDNFTFNPHLAKKRYFKASSNPNVETFQAAIDADPRFGNMWYDLGYSALLNEDYKIAIRGFLMAGFLNASDPESFQMALISAYNDNNLNLAPIIIFLMVEKFGCPIIDDLIEFLVMNNAPIELIKKLQDYAKHPVLSMLEDK